VIAGIVLAAGRSRRMGAPKAFLEMDGTSFLARAAAALREGGCDAVWVVTGPADDEVAVRIASQAGEMGAHVAVNPAPDSEQVDSLRAGLRALPEAAEAAVVLPVDVPRVEADAVRRVVDAFRERGAPVLRAVHGGRHGHPALFAELLDGDLPDGARTVIHAHAAELEEVEVADPGVLHDVDTPEDFRRLAGTA
jgi:CTP:molybdopterin cytidylyltransferase MocA